MRRTFDSLAPSWERIRAAPVYHDAFLAALDSGPRLTGQILPFNFPGWPQRALDVACGTGHASAWTKQRCPRARLSAIDISPRMVELAAAAVPGLAARVASGSALPYDDNSFELVTSLDGVFDCAELARVCAPNGAVLIVYSKGASCPVARSVEAIAAELTAAGMKAVAHKESWWCVWAVWPVNPAAH